MAKVRAETIHFHAIRYIPRYKGHDTIIRCDTILSATKLVANNLHDFEIIYFHNKFNSDNATSNRLTKVKMLSLGKEY